MKDSSTAFAIFCPDTPPMSLHHSPAHSQSQSRSWCARRFRLYILYTVELIKDTRQVARRNAWATIRYTHHYAITLNLCAYLNWRFGWRIACSVLYQVGQNLVNFHVIQFYRRQIIGQIQSYLSSSQFWLQTPQHIMNQFLHRIPFVFRLER